MTRRCACSTSNHLPTRQDVLNPEHKEITTGFEPLTYSQASWTFWFQTVRLVHSTSGGAARVQCSGKRTNSSCHRWPQTTDQRWGAAHCGSEGRVQLIQHGHRPEDVGDGLFRLVAGSRLVEEDIALALAVHLDQLLARVLRQPRHPPDQVAQVLRSIQGSQDCRA